MDIDHIFMLVDPHGDDITRPQSLGLLETYRRMHLGQGTQNVCFCFDNLFIELLWINDEGEVRSNAIARTGLYERSRWRLDGTNRFGIAWRGPMAGAAPPIPTWKFRPPYLTAEASIDVATDSDDLHQPVMFKSPGGAPPADWQIEKKGALQHPGGWGRVLGIELFLPRSVVPGKALQSMARHTILSLGVASDDQFSMRLHIERLGHAQPTILRLPA